MERDPQTPPPEGPDPRAPAVTFATTEHFTLQGARAATIAESTGRASMFLGAVSGGLVALGLVASATGVGTTFISFSIILLTTLAVVGFVTFERVLQCGVEDYGYVRRIARLRSYYFDIAPELTPYILSVPLDERLAVMGIRNTRGQRFLTVAGMVAIITSVIAGSAAGLIAGALSDRSLAVGLIGGILVGFATLVLLMRYRGAAWDRAQTAKLFVAEGETQDPSATS